MPMTATAILDGAVGQQPPAPIRVRTDKRTNIAWFASDPLAHSSIVKLIRKRAVIRMLGFAFYPLEHKLGNAARTIQCNRTLASVCHAEKNPGRMAGKIQRGIQAQALTNAGVAQHNARGKRVRQVDQLTGWRGLTSHSATWLSTISALST